MNPPLLPQFHCCSLPHRALMEEVQHLPYLTTSMKKVQVQSIPREIILEILQRLPPDTLIRFKRSCKSWCNMINDLINDPSFIELQLSRSKSQPRLLLWDIETYNIGELHLLEEYKEGRRDMLKARKIRLEYNNFHEGQEKIRVDVIGSCNGLICKIWASPERSHLVDPRICICNPLTKECAMLPLRPDHQKYIKSGIFGFGVDSTGKYKVIHIFKEGMYMWRSKIIALGESSWREIEFPDQFDHSICEKIKGMLFMDGALYCIVQKRIDQQKIILMFDIHDEKFHIIEFHPSIQTANFHDWSLTKIKDSLVLFRHESVFFRLWLIEIKDLLAKGNLMFQFFCQDRDKQWLVRCFREKNLSYEYLREISLVGMLSNNMLLFNADDTIRTIPGYQACSVGSYHLVYSVENKTLSRVRVSGTIPKLFQTQTFVPSFISPILVVCGKAKKDTNIRGPDGTKP